MTPGSVAAPSGRWQTPPVHRRPVSVFFVVLQATHQPPTDMKDFAAIDFETANREPSSVCSVGVVVMRRGEVADRIYRLIRPLPEYYAPINTQVHGLTLQDTQEAPPFPEVWRDIAPRIKGLTLVAHNSPFDEGCLRAVFAAYGLPYPGYTFRCTCRASRRLFGRSLRLRPHAAPSRPCRRRGVRPHRPAHHPRPAHMTPGAGIKKRRRLFTKTASLLLTPIMKKITLLYPFGMRCEDTKILTWHLIKSSI